MTKLYIGIFSNKKFKKIGLIFFEKCCFFYRYMCELCKRSLKEEFCSFSRILLHWLESMVLLLHILPLLHWLEPQDLSKSCSQKVILLIYSKYGIVRGIQKVFIIKSLPKKMFYNEWNIPDAKSSWRTHTNIYWICHLNWFLQHIFYMF